MIIFININNIPTPIPIYIYLLQLYFNVTGSILWIDILIIIPATNNNIIEIIWLFIYLNNIKYAIRAPIGSDNPDIKVLLSAFFLLLVA